MAGLGYKVFQDGNTLTATEVMGYMMEQQIMVFASSGARDSAIASPSEGMFAYLKDTDRLTYYDSTQWRNF